MCGLIKKVTYPSVTDMLSCLVKGNDTAVTSLQWKGKMIMISTWEVVKITK